MFVVRVILACCIRTEYGEILRISRYSFRMLENTDQKSTNTDTFHAVSALIISPFFSFIHFFDYYLVVREKSHPIRKVRLEILALSNRVTTRVFCKIISKLWLIYLSANVPWVLLKFILHYFLSTKKENLALNLMTFAICLM